ncbi:uncharacterized protein LOC124304828 [Neodiprion virginianus]|uniref:uncharacterized protein LOC124304828 n=1 Tax=Neodiprion virginianus TaxID=2961670 RepID=UPI001EE725D7|nr:uncharacterized protein LOC124304828 [Neodiprion virginianus]
MSNTAILIPERSLYVGIKQTYLLTLRNLTCKPVSYAWGLPPEKDGCRMEVYFNPKEGLIPPTDTAMIEVICLPTNTGVIEDLYIPCFVGGRQDPIMLGIQCTIDALFVTFLFLPPPNAIPSPCVDSIRVEWHKAGHTSALNLNNLKMKRHSKIEEEQELKNINLDAGQVIATTAVGPENVDIDNTSLVPSIENPSPPKQKLDHHNIFQKNESAEAQNKFVKEMKLENSITLTAESENEDLCEPRSWESLLKGIVWTVDRPDEFISLRKPQPIVPFYKTVVPPIMQPLAIEFTNLPLRTVEKRTFVIRNETPAASTFSLSSKQFGPTKHTKELEPEDVINSTYATVMGHKSKNYWDDIKPPVQGIVLVIEPTDGPLAPYETVPVDIYVYADTWGVYIDEIVVSIAGLPDYIFGVCIEVIGSPVTYPICKNGIHETPTVRFGTVNFETEKVTRRIIVENTSTVMLAINWQSYVIDSEVTKDSIPFNITLQMFSPLANEISNPTCTDLIKTSDSEIEKSEQDILDYGKCDSLRSSVTVESNLFQSQDETPWTQTSCCYESLASRNKVFCRNTDSNLEISVGTNNCNEDSVEYITETELTTTDWSEQTVDRETDLEIAMTPYYGTPDYCVFRVTPPELVIPVKGKQSLQITLNIGQFPIQNGASEVHGRLVGFIRIAPMHKYKADCYSRNDGAMLIPTEIKLEANILQPVVTNEDSYTEGSFNIFEN